MQHGSPVAQQLDFFRPSSESEGDSLQQQDRVAESQLAQEGPTKQPGLQRQKPTSDHPYNLQQQLQRPPSGSKAMAACSSSACAASMAGAAVCTTPMTRIGDTSSQGCRRLPLDSFGSSAAERSLGQQLHQLSFELKEQLHVDAKRTRTAPSCCSLCKAAQPSESSCVASCDQPSSVLAVDPGAAHAPPEVSQSSGSSPSDGKVEPREEEAPSGARQQKSDDCCLTCSCPCHNSNDAPSSRIVCFEGPRRPPTFAANLAELCRAFPSVHQGLIVSLLETAENDLQRAHALVRVVSDTNTGLHNPKIGGPMAKRKRCPDAESDCLGALESPPNCLAALRVEGPSRGSGTRNASCGMDVGDGNPRAALSCEQQRSLLLQQQVHASATASPDTAAARWHGVFPSLHMSVGAEQPPEAWCNEVAERLLWAIVTASSGEDAKAKAAALLREHAIQLARVQQEEPSQAELAKEAERQELAKRVELLQNDKLLLARAVKAQHEKLQTLQHSLAAKTEEALQLMQELSGAQQRLRSLRDAASALFLGASTGRNSPCRDNSFDRRFPDVF